MASITLPSTSAVPQAVVNFLSILQGALPSGVQLYTGGKSLGPFSAPNVVQVYGATEEGDWAELAPSYRKETHFVISGCVSVFTGAQSANVDSADPLQYDTTYIQTMQAAYGLIRTIGVAVGNNYTLGGAVRWALLNKTEWTPMVANQGGTIAEVAWEVLCEQRVETLT